MDDQSFDDGWLRFWRTFQHPWPVVLGFGAASAVSAAVYEILKQLATGVWKLVTE